MAGGLSSEWMANHKGIGWRMDTKWIQDGWRMAGGLDSEWIEKYRWTGQRMDREWLVDLEL